MMGAPRRHQAMALCVSALVLLWGSARAMSMAAETSTPTGHFKYRTYGEMEKLLLSLNETYPEVVKVFVAQDKYGLPYPPELQCNDGTKDAPCKQYVVHVTNHSTLPDPARPEVFISGALHGDERVGPATTMELIVLLAEYATAYANGSASLDASTAATKRWIHGLVNTRSVFLTPMTNAWGYAHHDREENGVDPNRDYNYMAAPKCMKAMTSRVINELWRDHLFQLAITFHGGMRAVAYEWGSPDHYLSKNPPKSEKSPDHTAQYQLANAMAVYAGAFEDDNTLYPAGTMNDIVYGVEGGMEDWAYAASWENEVFQGSSQDAPFQPCRPTSYGGYDAEKTVYNNATHRTFNILVETSNSKEPLEKDLGNYKDVYTANLDFYRDNTNFRVGHVTRNMRIALMTIEMVQPYVRWIDMGVEATQSQESSVSPDAFVPANAFVYADADSASLSSLGCRATAPVDVDVVVCNSTTCVVTADGAKQIKLQLGWEVLGAFQVDSTYIEMSTSPTFETSVIVSNTSSLAGSTRRYYDFPRLYGKPEAKDASFNSLFADCIDIPNATSAATLYVRTVAIVDQDWARQGLQEDAPSPRVPPQSHMVNARTNEAWYMSWNGHTVHGRLHWYSPTITVNIARPTTPSPLPSTPSSKPAIQDSTTTGSPTSNTTSTDAPSSAAPAVSPAPRPSARPNATVSTAPVSSPLPSGNKSTSAPTPSVAPETPTPAPNATATADNITSSSSAPSASPASNGSLIPSATNSSALNMRIDPNKNSSSLLGYGYLVMLSGGLVITIALVYLYRRVFRKKNRPYMSVAAQRQLEDEDDDEDDDEHGFYFLGQLVNGVVGKTLKQPDAEMECGFPQCNSLLRFHELILEGKVDTEALEANHRVSNQYKALRQCDGTFRRLFGQEENEEADGKSHEEKYMEHMYCVSSATCAPALKEWTWCLQQATSNPTNQALLEDCDQKRRLLDRCLKTETQIMVQASVPNVFQASRTS
ncbi:TPA: hypothetical protein N0F65_006264 [Lagenidium giganteum]|uniref:Peptidase M14 domain-containing protein n=1 Tax=Lagenidium giganteum TaxID=4803 RepID=A0AAV2Z0X1_9STRA|nr:TPA: hypothetical protein N0F65_006264 [Lagenidium giganteum]